MKIEGTIALVTCANHGLGKALIEALNRAVAIAMHDGPAAGLAALAGLDRTLADYHLFHATRADFLERAGRDPVPELRKALALAINDGERQLLERRLRDALAARPSSQRS